jgi:hypothetical protein|tara:strand:- start:3215 stop:3403 length:189 start_codon:yes stop_codon:yes gene_type:complete
MDKTAGQKKSQNAVTSTLRNFEISFSNLPMNAESDQVFLTLQRCHGSIGDTIGTAPPSSQRW